MFQKVQVNAERSVRTESLTDNVFRANAWKIVALRFKSSLQQWVSTL